MFFSKYLAPGLVGFALLCGGVPGRVQAAVESLAGVWRFQLDPRHEGEKAAWFKSALLETIRLPGTTDENAKGARNTKTNYTSHLSRVFPYYGAAWYQRELDIPAQWRGQRVTLRLERAKMTQVWVDDQFIGGSDSLAAVQVFDLSAVAAPGRHRLTICVDNKQRPPVNGGHQLSDDTQTDWNGIIGRIELRATDPVWLEDVQVFPDVPARRVKVRVTLGNISGGEGVGPEEILRQIATNMPPMYGGGDGVLLLLGVNHAQSLHEAGLTKRDIQQQLWELARLPISHFAEAFSSTERKAGRGDDTTVWRAAKPEEIYVAVAGGPGPQNVYIGAGTPKSRLVKPA